VRPIYSTATLLRRTIEECARDNTALYAAALAFYTVLSLAPALVVVVAITGMWLGRESARAEVVSAVARFTSSSAAAMVAGVVDKVEANSSLATAAGLLSMFFGATMAFNALQDSLNAVWRIPPRQVGWVRDYFTRRLLSFLFVLLLGVMLLASLLAGAVFAAMARLGPRLLPAPQFLLQAANFVVSLALLTVMFAVIYKVLPDVVIRWSDVWVGAAVTSLFFTVGKTLIGLYLGSTSLGSAYGAAGSLVVFLLWVYYSAQIFLFGAEFTEIYAETRGAAITPKKVAKALQEARQAPPK
jgi:membrane protein